MTDTKKQITKLQKTVNKWLLRWEVEPIFKELHWDGVQKSYGAAVAGDEDEMGSVGTETDSLVDWHFNRFAYAAISTSQFAAEEFSLAARYAWARIIFSAEKANASRGGAILQDRGMLYFSVIVLAGWKAEADAVGKALVKGLDTPLLDLRHNDRHEAGKVYRHFWFLMHLYCEAVGIKLNISKYSYPDDMSPYADVLADWRTTHLDKVQSFINAMADYHLAETKPTRYEEIAEFDSEGVMLFPYEILTFLRLREWAGLTNPASFEHPLMNQPLAKLPEPVPLLQPETPLLDQVIAKFQQEYPDSFRS